MIEGTIGRKLGITQVFSEDGRVVPVTIIEAGPCTVVQRKTAATDRYSAVQLGFGRRKESRATRAELGHVKKSGKGPFALLREFRAPQDCPLDVGSDLRVEDVFQPGDRVAVTGITKGRGTAGVLKRHGFGGFPAAHGTHEYFRHGGSIGNRSFPGRVFKGKRMAGRLGGTRMTVRNLEVLDVKPQEQILIVKGSVPGTKGGFLLVRRSQRLGPASDTPGKGGDA